MSDEGAQKIHITMDPNALYLEETFTDLKVGRIRKLTPVRVDGVSDKNRNCYFIGETQLMVQNEVVPVQCDIQATSLSEAVEKFPDAVNETLENMVAEAQKYKKENESRIIIPK